MIRRFVPYRSSFALAGLLAVGLLLAARLAGSGARPSHVLAISWQPAFCESHHDKPECSSQTQGRFDAMNFTLHGLWPQPVNRAYCGVPQVEIEKDRSGRWRALPMERLPAPLWRRLKQAMPGTMSGLERHEWVKHGTCMGDATPQRYFAASLALLDAINASPVRALFADNIGNEISGTDIRAAFNAAFGVGAGDRVRIACKRDGNRRLITELTLGLSGVIDAHADVASLVAAAPTTDPGCPGGIVDPVGLQ